MPRPRPRPHLRLVGPDELPGSVPTPKRAPTKRVQRQAPTFEGAVAPARRTFSWLIDDVCGWAFERGRAVNPGYLALVLAARTECWVVDEPVTYWTKDLLHGVLATAVPSWCHLRRLVVPEVDRPAIEAMLDCLAEKSILDPDSDPVPVMGEALHCACGIDVRCPECLQPYFGPSHGDLKLLG